MFVGLPAEWIWRDRAAGVYRVSGSRGSDSSQFPIDASGCLKSGFDVPRPETALQPEEPCGDKARLLMILSVIALSGPEAFRLLIEGVMRRVDGTDTASQQLPAGCAGRCWDSPHDYRAALGPSWGAGLRCPLAGGEMTALISPVTMSARLIVAISKGRKKEESHDEGTAAGVFPIPGKAAA